LDRPRTKSEPREPPAPGFFAATWNNNRVLVIVGGLGGVAVLLFCIAMLKFGLGSNKPQEVAELPSAEQKSEAEVPPPAESDEATTQTEAATAGAVEWSGVLEKVLAVREASTAEPGASGGTVHLVIKLDAPQGSMSTIDAVVPDLAFLREIADYRTTLDQISVDGAAGDGTAGDRVVASGVATTELHWDRRVWADRLPVVELKSLRKSDGSSPALVGARRELSLSSEALDLAAALRTADEEVAFEGVVADLRDSSHVVVHVNTLPIDVALPWSDLGSLPAGQTLRPGDSLRATAKVTGETARLDQSGQTLEVALLSNVRIIASEAPPQIAEASSSAPPSSPPVAEPQPVIEPQEEASGPKKKKKKKFAGAAPLFRVKAHDYSPTGLAWSPAGDLIATGGSDNRIVIWDGETGRQRQLAANPGRDAIDEFHWSPDGQWLAAMYGNQISSIWGVAMNATPATNNDMEGEYSRVAWNPITGQAAFKRNGVLCLVRPPLPAEPAVNQSRMTITAFAFSPDGTQLALAVTGYANFQTRYGVVIAPLIDYLNGTFGARPGAVLIELPDAVAHLSLREDAATGASRVAVHIDDQLQVYRVVNGVGVQEAALAVAYYYGGREPKLAWSADGNRLAHVSNDRLQLTELPAAAGAAPATSEIPVGERANAVAFAPDSKHLAIGQSGNDLMVWSCEAKSELATIKTPGATVRLDWRPDAQRLAALHSGGELTVWDMPEMPDFDPHAPSAGATASEAEMLALFAYTGAWAKYHEALKGIDSSKLKKEDKATYNDARAFVKSRLDSFSKRIGDLKKLNPRWDRAAPQAIGQYQYLLKEVVAMDPEKSTAKKLLADSIAESGETPYTP
jgi:WD40 repeat protein